jgi:hypothetical protein
VRGVGPVVFARECRFAPLKRTLAMKAILGVLCLSVAGCRSGGTTGDGRTRDAGTRHHVPDICEDSHCGEVVQYDWAYERGATFEVSHGIPNQICWMSGSWPITDSGGPPFEWQAGVPVEGVFPSLHDVFVVSACIDVHPGAHRLDVFYALVTKRYERSRLADGDVFIPFLGQATLDHQFVAMAAFKPAIDGTSAARVAITIQGGEAPQSYPDLAACERFVWGSHRATVVRLVPRRDPGYGVTDGEIGWAEVRLEDSSSDDP